MNWRGILALGMTGLLAACTATSAAEPDRVATRVAEDLAVARTLTAVAQAGITLAPASDTSEPAATAASTAAPLPTDTPAPLPTDIPTAAPPPTIPPRPTNTPLPEDPTVPGFGSPNGLIGQIVLPGYSGSVNPPVFTDNIVFQLKVYDPDKGHQDGAGIKAVRFEAFDPQGNTVIEQREGSAAYCSFGNPADSPVCDVWRFSAHNFMWPNGKAVCAGSGYSVNMVVETDDPAKNEANWGFEFTIASPDGRLPNCS